MFVFVLSAMLNRVRVFLFFLFFVFLLEKEEADPQIYAFFCVFWEACDVSIVLVFLFVCFFFCLRRV